MKTLAKSLFCMIFLANIAFADDVSQFNTQIQNQLKQLQTDQQQQTQQMNTQLQAQIKKVQTDLQQQIQSVNTQLQNQIKTMQSQLQTQIQTVNSQVQQLASKQGMQPVSVPAPAAPGKK
ncbi:Uncharacterised protein [Legionella steigerwaltii]|uniref:Apolipoprotein A1/A4/E domain n=1 Tax=Legionella steigerwaltii TaxID=460 RepID=A0A378LJA2_9GAMM|nr:hypothetical protein [Legionella steigerwaltii]KTD78748.1 hypothetical protein Lstg_1217 [Legionella steigerwaltii]STY24161.1 Uncharacterised protein [Legionella steigerwaltii]